MIKKLVIRDYMNFNGELLFDLSDISGYKFSTDCVKDNLVCKALLYGRNATGKSNLGNAFGDINYLVNDFDRNVFNKVYINADSTADFCMFEYTFLIKNVEVLYKYSLSNDYQIRYEMLSIDNELKYELDFKEKTYVFNDLETETNITETYKKHISSLKEGDKIVPFLRWMSSNYFLNDSSIIYDLLVEIQGMRYIDGINYRNSRYQRDIVKFFLDKNELFKFEKFLNDMGVICKLECLKLPNGAAELYFKHKKLIPFYENASSGTLALYDFYQRVYNFNNPSFIFYDEFDANLHYEMAEKLLQHLKTTYPNTQIIITTHNTNLMNNSLMRPDTIFILSQSGKITPLSKATLRELREGHNLEKMYISGEFDSYE